MRVRLHEFDYKKDKLVAICKETLKKTCRQNTPKSKRKDIHILKRRPSYQQTQLICVLLNIAEVRKEKVVEICFSRLKTYRHI